MLEPVDLDAERIIEVLNEHAVRYVVVGGLAGVLHGSPRATQDLDITPASDRTNLERLAAALQALDARLVAPDADEPLDWSWSADSFASSTTVTTRTSAGDLDLCFRPDAPGGRQYQFEDLARNAVVVSLPPDVPVASLEDVIASKEASGRDRDRRALPELRDLLVRQRGRQGPPSTPSSA